MSGGMNSDVGTILEFANHTDIYNYRASGLSKRLSGEYLVGSGRGLGRVSGPIFHLTFFVNGILSSS